MKKLISLAMALVMVFTLSIGAFAADQLSPNVYGTSSDAGDKEVVLTGKVSNDSVEIPDTVISITMPTTIPFQVETTTIGSKDVAAAEKGSQTTVAASDANVFYNFYTSAANVTNNSEKAINVEFVGLTDNNDLLKYMDVGMTSTDNTTGFYFDTTKDYDGADKVSLLSALDGKDGADAGSNVGTITLIGKAADKVNIGGKECEVNIPHAEYTLTTTLKVSLVSG